MVIQNLRDVGTNYCNCIIIEKVESLKYLGLRIDYLHKQNYHIEHVAKSIKNIFLIFLKILD